jgi:hypothetical protein
MLIILRLAFLALALGAAACSAQTSQSGTSAQLGCH